MMMIEKKVDLQSDNSNTNAGGKKRRISRTKRNRKRRWRFEKNDLHRRRPAVRRGRRASDAILQKRTRGRRVDETDRGREERMPQRLRVREI